MLMKFSISVFLTAACLVTAVSLSAETTNVPDEIKVMSYNIRLGSANDGTNSWNLRYMATKEMIEDKMPDVFGVQEALDYQVLFIDEMCEDYECVGVGRDDGRKKGEYMSIFWNKKTIKKVKWGTFWLSETPDKPSKGWDAECMRTATWAILKHKKSGKQFLFVNTHLDHVGEQAQRKGLALIAEKIRELNPKGLPVVLTGDFNVKPDNPALDALDGLLKCTRETAPRTDRSNTYNAWGKAKPDMIIDYIYMSGFSSCPEYQTVTDRYQDRKFISDHYPVMSRLIF